MNTISQIIDDSALPIEIKTELKLLSKQLSAALEEERDASSWTHKAKAGCNERQYSKRLSEPMSPEKRNEVLVNQFAYRAWFVNGAFRAYEARRRIAALAQALKDKITGLETQAEPSSKVALVALARMAREVPSSDADALLATELDSVRELTRERLFEAVRSIFASKRDRDGIFAKTNFSSTELMLLSPTSEQRSMDEAIAPAIAIRAQFEELWSEFTSARSAFNVPQFTQRIEQCVTSGNTEKLEQIRCERRNAEARLFVAATRYEAAHGELVSVQQRLEAATQAAAVAVKDVHSLEGVKSMTHCLGAWHWLGELTGYIEGKYRSCNPGAVLEDLDFDAGAFLSA